MLRGVLLDSDDSLRERAIAYVNALAERAGGFVRRQELESFEFEGSRVRLIAPRQGIWKPSSMTAALSFVTTFTPPTERPPYETTSVPTAIRGTSGVARIPRNTRTSRCDERWNSASR